jgi:adenosylmethionine-8-amino-7-oxononanoate aminotransferase
VDGVSGDHIILAPPLNISREDLERLVDLLEETYDAVEERVSVS